MKPPARNGLSTRTHANPNNFGAKIMPKTMRIFSPSPVTAMAKIGGDMNLSRRKHKVKRKSELVALENPLCSLGLTARETEVLILVAQGKTNYEIGVILSACTGTICKHVEHILCKLNVKNRTAAAAIAFAALARAKI
jgi:DNA-binding NarL/FixJ family response regulator